MEHEPEVLDCEAEQIIADIGIRPCPAILTKLMREMRNDEPDFVKLGKLIGGDVSLAAAMLKTVNSPFYGYARWRRRSSRRWPCSDCAMSRSR